MSHNWPSKLDNFLNGDGSRKWKIHRLANPCGGLSQFFSITCLSGQSWGFEYSRPGSNLRLRLPNGFVLGDTRANSPRFVNSQLVCLLPVGILNWEREVF